MPHGRAPRSVDDTPGARRARAVRRGRQSALASTSWLTTRNPVASRLRWLRPAPAVRRSRRCPSVTIFVAASVSTLMSLRRRSCARDGELHVGGLGRGRGAITDVRLGRSIGARRPVRRFRTLFGTGAHQAEGADEGNVEQLWSHQGSSLCERRHVQPLRNETWRPPTRARNRSRQARGRHRRRCPCRAGRGSSARLPGCRPCPSRRRARHRRR